jgi:hypothetical protein
MGAARNAASTARRPTLRERLSLRRHLPSPRQGRGAGVAAFPDTEAMQLHLEEIRHTTPYLVMPENITPIWLPSRAPELNPVENVWQCLRQTWLSNRVFETYADIVNAACEALTSGLTRSEVRALSITHIRRSCDLRRILCVLYSFGFRALLAENGFPLFRSVL